MIPWAMKISNCVFMIIASNICRINAPNCPQPKQRDRARRRVTMHWIRNRAPYPVTILASVIRVMGWIMGRPIELTPCTVVPRKLLLKSSSPRNSSPHCLDNWHVYEKPRPMARFTFSFVGRIQLVSPGSSGSFTIHTCRICPVLYLIHEYIPKCNGTHSP